MPTAMIVFISVLVSCHGGYIYSRPNIQFDVPTNNNNRQQSTEDATSQLYETEVAYSVPYEEYNYLRNHKLEYQISHFNEFKAQEIFESNSSELESLIEDKTVTGTVNNQNAKIDASALNSGALIESQRVTSKENFNGGKAVYQPTEKLIFDNTVISADEIPILKQVVGNIESKIQSTIPQIDNVYANEQVIAQNNLGQHVTKHISFHVPPPEIEEPRVVRITEPPKKTYKIIFIKVPSQDTASLNTAQIQQALSSQVAPVEDKTLIYVLVKKPEEVQILSPPPPTPSEHEVLFVNYKDSRTPEPLPIGSESFLKRSI